MDRFKPGIKARADAANTINILDVIGESFFSSGITTEYVANRLDEIGDQDVTVVINSPGGDVFDGIGIYNLLREHSGNVTVKVIGMAASAASIIAMAGDRVEIGASAFIMVHNAWVLALGNKEELRAAADHLEPIDATLANVYVARTGIDKARAIELMDQETWINSEQAIEQGFADALLPSDQISEGEEPKNNAIRKIEQALTRNCDFSRSQARSLLSQIRGEREAAPTPSKTLDASRVSSIVEALTS